MNPYNLLKTLGYPVAHMKFEEKVSFPYLIYKGAGSDNLLADNKVYRSKYNYSVELYFEEKDETTERKIENLFNDNEIPWSKSEDIFILEENMFVIYYFI